MLQIIYLYAKLVVYIILLYKYTKELTMENTKVKAKLPISILCVVGLAVACVLFFVPLQNGTGTNNYQYGFLDFVLYNSFISVLASVAHLILLLVHISIPQTNGKKAILPLVAFCLSLAPPVLELLGVIQSYGASPLSVAYIIIVLFGIFTILTGNKITTLRIIFITLSVTHSVLLLFFFLGSGIKWGYTQTAFACIVEILKSVALIVFLCANKFISILPKGKVKPRKKPYDNNKLYAKPLLILLTLSSIVFIVILFDNISKHGLLIDLLNEGNAYGYSSTIPALICLVLMLAYFCIPHKYKWKTIAIPLVYLVSTIPFISLLFHPTPDATIIILFSVPHFAGMIDALTGHRLKALHLPVVVIVCLWAVYMAIMMSVEFFASFGNNREVQAYASGMIEAIKYVTLALFIATNKIHPIIPVSQKQERALADEWEIDPETGIKIKRV